MGLTQQLVCSYLLISLHFFSIWLSCFLVSDTLVSLSCCYLHSNSLMRKDKATNISCIYLTFYFLTTSQSYLLGLNG